MSPKEIIQNIYENDGLRNDIFLNEVIHNDVVLEWHSSKGLLELSKQEILNLSREMKRNYSESNIEIKYCIEENNKISLAYINYVTPIENTSQTILLLRAIIIWEFENGKIVKGLQISQPT